MNVSTTLKNILANSSSLSADTRKLLENKLALAEIRDLITDKQEFKIGQLFAMHMPGQLYAVYASNALLLANVGKAWFANRDLPEAVCNYAPQYELQLLPARQMKDVTKLAFC